MGKRTISILIPVRPSVRLCVSMKTILLPLVGILENFDLFFEDLFEKILQLLKSEKNNRHFTTKPIRIYGKISPKNVYNNTIYRQIFRSIAEQNF